MIALVVSWRARPGEEEAVAKLFAQLAAATREESGCVLFAVHRHLEDGSRFLIYEQYSDQKALEAHRASSHFLTIARGSLLSVAEREWGDLYRVLA